MHNSLQCTLVCSHQILLSFCNPVSYFTFEDFYVGGGSAEEAYDPSKTAISMPLTGMKQIGVDLMYEVEGKAGVFDV